MADSTEPEIQSERFRDPAAEITFRSSDNVLFRVHRQNLQFAAGLSADEMISSNNGIVPLPETSNVLELLFQFIYPRPPSDLEDLDFEVLAGLAEAAEKYQVYFCTGICKELMRAAIPEHAIEVLTYAVKHGHASVMDEAAKSSRDLAVEKVFGMNLPSDVFIGWVRYKNYWLEAQRYACSYPNAINDIGHFGQTCEHWPKMYTALMHPLAQMQSFKVLENLDEVFTEDIRKICHQCHNRQGCNWRDAVKYAVNRIPKFSSLVS